MGLRFRNATPGMITCLAASVLLAIVSFNTPFIKSLDFLEATYSSGTYNGTLTLGTLGFCHTVSGTSNCTGPTVGYEFDPNDVFGVTSFDIPETITKYLTYVLILHVIALGFAGIATIIALFAHSPTFPLLCLAIWVAGIASSISFIALIFDLAMFYIAKSRIDDVDGASATIGKCVWLTLAAWVILALSGCFFGIGNCCGSCRDKREPGDPDRRYKRDMDVGDDDYKMRMMAIDNERQRKAMQEQGLPSFQELTPLKDDADDQYLMDHHQQQAVLPVQTHNNLARNGSVLQGVGVGYGRRTPRTTTSANDYAAQGQNPYAWGSTRGYQNIQAPAPVARRLSDATNAGDFVGVGAGGAGVEQPPPPVPAVPQQYAGGYGGGGSYGEHQYNNEQPGQYGTTYGDNAYGQETSNQYGVGNNQNYNNNVPYGSQNQTRQQSYDPYTQTSYSDPYTNLSPSANNYGAAPMAIPTPVPAAIPMPVSRSPPASMPIPQPSSHQTAAPNFYTANSADSHDPGPRVSYADPYGGYTDGLSSIGMMAQGNAGASNSGSGQIQEPRPQHLVQDEPPVILQSPISTSGHALGQQRGIVGQPYDDEDEDELMGNRPPSYTAGNFQTASVVPGGGREKSQYRF